MQDRIRSRSLKRRGRSVLRHGSLLRTSRQGYGTTYARVSCHTKAKRGRATKARINEVVLIAVSGRRLVDMISPSPTTTDWIDNERRHLPLTNRENREDEGLNAPFSFAVDCCSALPRARLGRGSAKKEALRPPFLEAGSLLFATHS